MASEKGPVATEAPPLPASTISEPAIPHDPFSVESLQADATRATASLKRARETTPTSPSSVFTSHLGSDLSPSKAARLIGLTSRHSPAPLTGAAALEDEKRRREEEYRQQVSGASENPAYRVHSELMSASALAMSRPQDAPVTNDAHPDEQIIDHQGDDAIPPQTGGDMDQPEQAEQPDHVEQPVLPEHTEHNEHTELAEEHVDHTDQADHAGHAEHMEHPEHTEHVEHAEQPEHAEHAEHMMHTEPTEHMGHAEHAEHPGHVEHVDHVEHMEHRSDVAAEQAANLAALSNNAAHVTASPGPMDIDGRGDRAGYAPQPQAQMEDKSNPTSLSYPGMVPPSAAMPAPPRTMSMPMTPNQPGGPKSPNSKKHKCPYCETEFTRHHNLKSHLLTHSQEKPFVCPTCQMRFRRLHDLKRHGKLHTGEKPHVCPKCDRKFARGDALARHSKGPGGCVSRRGSLGFETEDYSHLDVDDSTMTGVVYENPHEADMTEEERRRLSMSGMKAPHVQGNEAVPHEPLHHLRTYSPPGTSTGRLYPPNVERGSNAPHAANASISSMHSSGPNSMYAQSGMTESPKPLSPGLQPHDGSVARQRSPSLTTQFQQQQFGRQQADRQTSSGSSSLPSYPEALVAQLVSVSGFPSGDGHYAAAGQASAPGAISSAQAASAATGQSNIGTASAGAQAASSTAPSQNGGSGDSTSNNIFATDQGIWAYIHSLEERLTETNARVSILEQSEKTHKEDFGHLMDEVVSLRKQLEMKEEAPAPETVI
ncbi:uncharacterized protein PG986_013431 [Apiospora aurea]|uniref:C2H2-type domain-containing protein n=1 Tax=Apiospora aurea TaxID=335848 RepID=A0ABR1PVV2_9PEZI